MDIRVVERFFFFFFNFKLTNLLVRKVVVGSGKKFVLVLV